MGKEGGATWRREFIYSSLSLPSHLHAPSRSMYGNSAGLFKLLFSFLILTRHLCICYYTIVTYL
jgi:hypothetical protein